MHHAVQNLLKIVLTIAIAMAAFTIGLGVHKPGPQSLVRQPRQLVRALLAILVAVPLFAFAFLELLPLSQVARSGIFIAVLSIGIGPVGGMKVLEGSSPAARRAFELNVLMLLVSIVYVPLMVAFLAAALNRDVSLDVAGVAKIVFLRALIPMTVGVVVARTFPRAGEKLHHPLARAVTITVGLLVVVVLVAKRHEMGAVGIGGWLASFGVAAGAVAIGHLMGGPQDEMRGPLAVAAAMRFPALALLLTQVAPLGARLLPPVIVYIVAAVVVSTVYSSLRQRHGRGTTAGHAQTPAHA